MNRSHFLLTAIISAFITTFFLATPTFALDGITLQISPTSHKIALDPGNEYTDSVSIQNLNDQPIKYKMSLRPYQASDIFYNPDFATENNYTQIVKWITFAEPSGELAPHSNKDIKYTIKVPADVPSGGQYATIVAETPAQTQAGSIEIISSVGSILYAHIGSNTREEGSLVSQNIWPFQIGSPITTENTVKNTGNVDFDVTTTLKVSKLLTGNTVYDDSEDPLVQTVLPDSTRFIRSSWYDTPKLGVFTVTQTTSFLDQTYDLSGIVIVCPLWLTLVIATIIALAIFLLIFNLIRYLKNRARRRKALD